VLCSDAGCPTTTSKVSSTQSSPGGLIFGLIHLRSPTFIGARSNAAMQVADVNGIRRTIILTPENRKVGGSTPPLPLYLTCMNRGFLDLFLRAPSQLSANAILQRSSLRMGHNRNLCCTICELGAARCAQVINIGQAFGTTSDKWSEKFYTAATKTLL
jgi:hypothetical protein